VANSAVGQDWWSGSVVVTLRPVPTLVKAVQRIAVLFHSVVGKTLPEPQSDTFSHEVQGIVHA
jgi:hypothetical protein